MQKLTQLLKETSFYPIMGVELNHENTIVMDFTANNMVLEAIDLGDTKAFSEYVFGLLADASCAFGIGGYMEPRAIYQRSEVFGTSPEDFRNIHAQVDIWAEPGQAVYAPLDGKIHSFQDNGAFGNYGPAIILEHQLKGEIFYSLYGHLKRSDLIGLEVGQQILAGQVFCHIGPYPENGDWPPHLHFQLIVDMEGNQGDYPGVCAAKDQDKYQRNCPDPKWIIGFEESF